jgi:hypothetical protein
MARAMLVGRVQGAPQLVVDLPRRGLAEGDVAHGRPADAEGVLALAAVVDRAHGLAHAELHDHAPAQVAGLVDVVARPGREVAEHALFGRPPAVEHGQPVEQLGAGHQVAVLGRHLHRVAEGADAPRDDADLLHGVGAGGGRRADRVAGFVVGDDLALGQAQAAALLLEAGDGALDGLFDVDHLDVLLLAPGRQQRGFVQAVGEVRAREARGDARHRAEVHVVGQLHRAGVDLQDGLAPAHVGAVHQHLPVEAPCPQQRAVEDLRPVRGGHDDDALAAVEAVHLDEELVEGLLALVVAAHRRHPPAGAPDGVELVDEDDAGGALGRLPEEVAHAGGAHPDEHLDEVRARDREEGHARLAGHRAGQQGLAGARGPDQQHALGDLAAQGGELLGGLEEVDDLLQLLLGLLDAGDVVEAHAGAFFGGHLGVGLAEGGHPRGRPAFPPEHHREDHDHQQEGDEPADRAVAGGLAGADLDLVLLEQGQEALVPLHPDDLGGDGLGGVPARGGGVRRGLVAQVDDLAVEHGLVDLARGDVRLGLAPRDVVGRDRLDEGEHQEAHAHQDGEVEQQQQRAFAVHAPR